MGSIGNPETAKPDGSAAVPTLTELGAERHAFLTKQHNVHRDNLGREFPAEIGIIIEYEKFLCTVTDLVGRHRPTDDVDRALRDLLADTFDMLYVARTLTFDGYSSAPFPLLRRAFECICIFHYMMVNQDKAKAWANGAWVGNAEIRKFMSGQKHSEYADSLQTTYGFQSKNTHPNRGRMVMRQLGEGNPFSLASAGSPPWLFVAIYLLQLLDMWAWFSHLTVTRFSALVGDTVPKQEEALAEQALAAFHALTARMRSQNPAKDVNGS